MDKMLRTFGKCCILYKFEYLCWYYFLWSYKQGTRNQNINLGQNKFKELM